MIGLKTKLVALIKDRNGELFTFDEMQQFCARFGYRVSNGERRLRESKNIEPVFNGRKYIVGYRYIEKGTQRRMDF